MKIIYAIFLYNVIVSVCVVARGHGGHGSHSGHSGHSGHYSHSYGGHGYHGVSASHAHYSYHPPRHIYFTCRSCSSPQVYPVYRSPPPAYVYVYKDSGSRYNQLLTGLALYNLGRSSHGGSSHSNMQYTARREEKCSLQVIGKAHFEETEFPCFMISSFVNSSSANKSEAVDITSVKIDVKPYINSGTQLELKPDYICVLWHNLTMHKERNLVSCALLQEYANTVRPRGVPVYVWLPTVLGIIIVIYMCCLCVPKKRKDSVKEEAPLNDVPMPGYCANY